MLRSPGRRGLAEELQSGAGGRAGAEEVGEEEDAFKRFDDANDGSRSEGTDEAEELIEVRVQ